MRLRPTLVGCLALAALTGLTACASRTSEPPAVTEVEVMKTPPKWITDTLASDLLGGIDESLIHAAAADPSYIEVIEAAVKPGESRQASNLRYLLSGIDYRMRRAEHLALARRMHQMDPVNHAETLVWVAWRHPFAECEAELLWIAFQPERADREEESRRAARWAAQAVVQRLALDVPRLPRALPKGAPELNVWMNDPRHACVQHTICVGYGYGDTAASAKFVEECLADDARRPGNDHEVGECETVLDRAKTGR